MKNINRIKEDMGLYAEINYGKSIHDCTNQEMYQALAKTIMKDITPKWLETKERYKDKKQAYYLSAEFLMGRALDNNLNNLNNKEEVKEILSELDIDYKDIEDSEKEPGLGNGGLGRLAACFLDSAATLNYPLTGYGIRYEYGIFVQSFTDGFQYEEGDNWLEYG